MDASLRRSLALIAGLSISVLMAQSADWRLTRNSHFEVYSQTSDDHARRTLAWFEQLRAFFQQHGGLKLSPAPHTQLQPVKIIVFASEREYEPYRLRSTADAYFVGTDAEDYIVMRGDDPASFALAAHEYAHLALRDSNLELPPWLKEGLAEFFSTFRIADHAAQLGGALPARVQTLERSGWIPIEKLMSVTEETQQHQSRAEASLFYAESWALAEMLALSPAYASDFPKFVSRVGSGTEAGKALTAVYGRSADFVAGDLRAWLNRPVMPVIQLPAIVVESGAADVSAVPPLAARILLAQILLSAREFDRAENFFSKLAQDAPDSAEVSAALGVIALHRGDAEGARRAWKRAIDQGIADAKLCYEYAILADQAALPAAEIRPVLERAIALQPDSDDVHYQLALLEKNAGHYEIAIREFQAMHTVSSMRAFAYWLALADSFNELGRRDEAVSAARKAAEHAITAAERAKAAQQVYIAQTDLGVQFARDSAGQLQLVTTRTPHQQLDWNPFVEPGDDIRQVRGALRAINCGDVTTIAVESGGKQFALTIPDLQHVQMRQAPPDFVCGEQATPPAVIVDYARTPNAATAGVVRGMLFQ